MALERRRVVARGRVQGVGFRLFTMRVARDLGLSGFVRNLPDGRSVEALAQGEGERLGLFVTALREGPGGSFVGEVEESVEPLIEGEEGFAVVA